MKPSLSSSYLRKTTRRFACAALKVSAMLACLIHAPRVGAMNLRWPSAFVWLVDMAARADLIEVMTTKWNSGNYYFHNTRLLWQSIQVIYDNSKCCSDLHLFRADKENRGTPPTLWSHLDSSEADCVVFRSVFGRGNWGTRSFQSTWVPPKRDTTKHPIITSGARNFAPPNQVPLTSQVRFFLCRVSTWKELTENSV